MEFFEDEGRPRFMFQSRSVSSPASETSHKQKKSKSLVSISVSVSLVLFALALFFLKSDTLRFLSLWFSVSFLVGPFAPLSLTGGDIRVGGGEIVDFPQEDESHPIDEPKKKGLNKRQKANRSEESGFSSTGASSREQNAGHNSTNGGGKSVHLGTKALPESDGPEKSMEESEWTEEDFDLLRKLILKHPVGKPRRWEVITEALKGRHSVQSVIKMAKSLGESKPEDSDSYSKFLRNRKPVDKRTEESTDFGLLMSSEEKKNESAESTWTSGEDFALLNAMKVFPKDAPMRWDKIAAAVPGKSKAACMKRMSELKKGFRSTKAAGES